jgi:hypothetical protein
MATQITDILIQGSWIQVTREARGSLAIAEFSMSHWDSTVATEAVATLNGLSRPTLAATR